MSEELIAFLATLSVKQLDLMREWQDADADVPPDGVIDLLQAQIQHLMEGNRIWRTLVPQQETSVDE